VEKSIAAAEANRRFSRILREVQGGGSFVVTARGRPVARIVPISEVETKRRAAHADLLRHLAERPVVNVPPWTRDELYDDDDHETTA
jgi:prevent-host-death family protein